MLNRFLALLTAVLVCVFTLTGCGVPPVADSTSIPSSLPASSASSVASVMEESSSASVESAFEPEDGFEGERFETVAAMQASESLAEGDIVCTVGYYLSGDGGGATYEIVPGDGGAVPGDIALVNALTARLQPADGTVAVLQFGALGDGETDDWQSVQDAFSHPAGTVGFPDGRDFLIRNSLLLPGDKTILGNGSTLITDDGYAGTTEFFLGIRDVQNVVLDGLNITGRETSQLGSKTQLGVRNASSIVIRNCVFTGPEARYNQDGTSAFRAVNNIDLYSNWHDVTITGCTLVLTHDSEAGLCLMARDIKGQASGGLMFEGNTCYKVCHDEIVAIGAENATVSNVVIRGNTFKTGLGRASASNLPFSIGLKTTVMVSDIVFEDNQIDVWQAYMTFMMGGPARNITIRNNTIRVQRGPSRSGDNESANYVFYRGSSPTGSLENVVVSGNQVTIDNQGEYQIQNFANMEAAFTGNTITVLGEFSGTLFGGSVLLDEDNRLEINE